MRISLPLLILVLCACAGVTRSAGGDPATHAIRMTDSGAGVIPTAISNVGHVAGRAAGALCFADVVELSSSTTNRKA